MGNKRNVGRPTDFTPEALEKLMRAFAMGLNNDQCCLYADVGRTAFYNYCRNNPEFTERRDLLRQSPSLKAKVNIVQAINDGDEDLSKWWLERKCKDEFSLKQEVETTITATPQIMDDI